ncbi:MAG: rhamnulokinase [Propionivibrio sp.]
MDTFVAAVDLGASSGRVLLACLGAARETLSIEEVHRFDNGFVKRDGHDCWDVNDLVAQINVGLERIVERGIKLASVGVDTWAVDFVLLDADGRLLGQPVAYRDHRTDGVMDEVFKTIPREKLYERTGIAFLQFNTIYQLVALLRENPDWLPRARTLLLMPDYLQYRLCGTQSCETTNASTSQLISVKTKSWDIDLLRSLGIPLHWFLPLTQPGTVIGEWVSPNGSRVKVITPATHDTASAVLAVPLEDEDSVYISSGTWSLMGIESSEPYCDERALAANFTNEGGVDGTYRVLKNIMGLWLIQRLRDAYPDLWFTDLVAQAENATPFAYLIDPNDDRFLNPASMKQAIADYCRETNQGEPQSAGEFARCIFESLAFLYRQTLEALSGLTGRQYKRIHIVGGGSQNDFLNQLCADFCRLPVFTGPIEASALGNITCQLRALGHLADRKAIRDLIRKEFSGQTLHPRTDNAESIEQHWRRFQRLGQQSS